MSRIGQLLDVILEESTTVDAIDTAMSLSQELEETRYKLNELQSKIAIMRDKICSRLAQLIRKRNPALSISVSRKGCKIGYKSKSLLIRPDVSAGVWDVSSNDDRFVNKYLARHSTKRVVNKDMDTFVDSIITHFKDHYKAINEDIIGTGILLVDGVNSTLINLAEWPNVE